MTPDKEATSSNRNEKFFQIFVACLGALIGAVATIYAANTASINITIEQKITAIVATTTQISLETMEAPTLTPFPTHTPYSTYTPYPTYTTLPTYTIPPETPTPFITSTPTPTDALINKTVESNFEKFNMILVKVDFQENGRMRWYVDFWNQTIQDFELQLYLERSYVVDENGKRYSILAASQIDGVPNFHKEYVQAGVRISRWLDFESPKNGAKTFKLVLVSDSFYGAPKFPPAEIKLDY